MFISFKMKHDSITLGQGTCSQQNSMKNRKIGYKIQTRMIKGYQSLTSQKLILDPIKSSWKYKNQTKELKLVQK